MKFSKSVIGQMISAATVSILGLGCVAPANSKIPVPTPSATPSASPSPLASPKASPLVSAPADLSINLGANPTNGAYTFTTIVYSTSEDVAFTLSNSGAQTASSIAVIGTPPTAPFSFKGGSYPGVGGNCGTSLAADSTCTLVITFAPPSAISYTGTLQLAYSSGSTNLNLNLALSGLGELNCASPNTIASQTTLQTGYWLQNDNDNGNSSSSGFATSFTLNAPQTLAAAVVYVFNNTGIGAAGTVSVTIHGDSSNSPAVGVLGQNPEATFPVSSLPNSNTLNTATGTTATFAAPLALAAGKYWLVIQATGVSSSEGITVWGSSSGSNLQILPLPGYWYWAQASYGPSMGYKIQVCQ